MALFKDFVAGEINALNLVCDDEELIAQMELEVEDAICEDEYLLSQISDIIDSVIFSHNLPGIDD